MLKGKKVILGISGGIAAYKTPFIIRLLVKAGAEVRVVATENAMEFVTRTTLETLSKNKLYTRVFSESNDYTTEHVSLTDWADVMLVAPATANAVGKFARGIADDALSTTFMAFNRQVYIAPSMNTKMYANWAFQENLCLLQQHGVKVMEPEEGFLACGYEGKGRMAEPEDIVSFVHRDLENQLRFTGKKVLITAGATVEPIDPVRFISNYSTGKMGYALADIFTSMGATVTLISGDAKVNPPHIASFVKVQSAQQMFDAVMQEFDKQDIIIMSAAVADYTPVQVADEKIKKSADNFGIQLKKTMDILAAAGKRKSAHQTLIGFALETNDELAHAKQKLGKKNLDFIVLNSLRDEGAGFGYDTNKISILNKKGDVLTFDLKSKKEVAQDIALYTYEYTK